MIVEIIFIMKKYMLFVILFMILISLLFAIAIILAEKAPKSNLDFVKVNLRYNHVVQFEEFYNEKWSPSARFAGFYTAQQKGFYEQNSLDVALIPGSIDFSLLNLLHKGEVFWISGVDQALELRDKGGALVILAVIFQKNPFVLVTIDGNITKPIDLIGKKIGLKKSSDLSNSDVLFYSLLNNTNISKEQVEIVSIGFDTSSLLKGEVDAYEVFALNELIDLQEKADKMGYKLYTINLADYGVEFYADAILTTADTIKRNPELVSRFVNASLQGWNYAYANPDEAINYTLMYSHSLDSRHESLVMQQVLGLLMLDSRPIGYIDKNILQDMQNMLMQKGLIMGLRNPINITDEPKAYAAQFMGGI